MLIVASLLALSLGLQQEAVRTTATLSSARVEVGSPVTLRITVETRGEAPDGIHLPQLPRDLDIVGTSDFTQSIISMPGGRSRSTRREIVIVAHRPGAYRIPAATIDVGGRSYRTRSLDLIVTAGPSATAPGGARAPGWSAPFDAPTSSTLRMWVWPDTVFVGQQVLLHAEATFGDDARPRQSRAATFDPPAPPGFWIQDVPNPVAVSLRVQEGRTIETQTFRRALFPLGAGSYSIPPAKLFYESRRGFLSSPETRQISSDSVRLVVLPLPARGRPDGFNGAVGRLRIRGVVAPDRVAVGEAAMVTVEVEGIGNVKALPEPLLPELPHTEVFSSTQESSVEVVNLNVAGTKRFRWVVVPERPGSLAIPPIEYSVFDPELRQYVTHSTDTLRIDVLALPGPEQEDTLMRPLRVASGREPAGWARTGGFVALQAAPLLVFALAMAVRRRREAPPGPRQHHRRLRDRLAELKASPVGRLAELERLLVDAAVLIAGADPDEPVTSLRAQGRGAAAYALSSLLREISRIRFAPDAHTTPAAVWDRAEAYLEMLRPPSSSWRRAVPFVLVLALAACGGPSVPSADEAALDRGVRLYQAGDFAGAARSFHNYARAHPRDPNGWYNLGLAAHAAGDPGRAAWAWLRANRLSPRDADVMHNLARLGASDAARQIRPPDMLASGERLLVMAVAWWILLLALGLRRRRPRGAHAAVAAGVLVIGLATAAAAFDTARPLVVTPLGSGTRAFAGPSVHDDEVGVLGVGSVVRVVERRGDFIRVRLHHGRDAWVERATVAAP